MMHHDDDDNKCQTNLAKGDIALLSYSPVLAGTCDTHFGEGAVVEGQRLYYSKERWWFPIGSPLWPLRYL